MKIFETTLENLFSIILHPVFEVHREDGGRADRYYKSGRYLRCRPLRKSL
jgi:hypothetical protein